MNCSLTDLLQIHTTEYRGDTKDDYKSGNVKEIAASMGIYKERATLTIVSSNMW